MTTWTIVAKHYATPLPGQAYPRCAKPGCFSTCGSGACGRKRQKSSCYNSNDEILADTTHCRLPEYQRICRMCARLWHWSLTKTKWGSGTRVSAVPRNWSKRRCSPILEKY